MKCFKLTNSLHSRNVWSTGGHITECSILSSVLFCALQCNVQCLCAITCSVCAPLQGGDKFSQWSKQCAVYIAQQYAVYFMCPPAGSQTCIVCYVPYPSPKTCRVWLCPSAGRRHLLTMQCEVSSVQQYAVNVSPCSVYSVRTVSPCALFNNMQSVVPLQGGDLSS